MTQGASVESPAQTPKSAKDQSAAPPAGSVATFHSEARLVVVDVVVTDDHGQTISDLKKEDFTVLEVGRPQTIQFFEPHQSNATVESVSIQLPPNQYSNFPTHVRGDAVNIVLFDVLNTPFSDQMYARRQMVQFLKTLPRGQQVAVFVLGTQLRMIAGFNSASEDLVAAAKKILPDNSPLLDTEEERQRTEDQITLMEQLAQPPSHPGTDSRIINAARTGPPNQFDLMRQFVEDDEAVRVDARAAETLDAFRHLARSVAGYSGRKNLLWLSEGFPISFNQNHDSLDPARNVRSYISALQDTSDLLSSAQVSIYPIDIRGLMNSGVAIASTAVGVQGVPGERPKYGSLLSRQTTELAAVHDTMDDIADQTGGKAFYNTNDLKLAMQRSIETGSHYYTLAYIPQNKNWNSKYRKIEIKLARSGLKAEYRRGYFAIPHQKNYAEEGHDLLVAAMQPATPDATMLLLRVQVRPPSREDQKARIDYGVYAPDLVFADGPDQRKHAKVEFVAVAWDKDNQAAGNASETMDLALKPEDYQAVLDHGLPAHLELALRPGAYTLRLGVLDYGNNKIGTLNVPLRVEDLNSVTH